MAVDDVGLEALDIVPQQPRDGDGQREVAAVEMLNRGNSNCARLTVGACAEAGGDDEHLMPRLTIGLHETLDGIAYAAHQGRVSIREHQNPHEWFIPRLFYPNGVSR